MTEKIKFGTDGWRGVIAEDYTFDNVRRAAQGFASYMLSIGKKGEWIIIGHDNPPRTGRFECHRILLVPGEDDRGLQSSSCVRSSRIRRTNSWAETRGFANRPPGRSRRGVALHPPFAADCSNGDEPPLWP